MVKTKITDKKLIFLTILFVVLIAYFLIFENRIEQNEKSKNNLFSYTIADIKKFEIQRSDKVLSMERVMNDWFIKKPRELAASKSDIDAFLYDVKDLQKDKVVGKNLPDLTAYGLKDPKKVFRIWVASGKGEQLLTLDLGEQNPDKSGTYAKFENEPEVFLLEMRAESILDKDLLYFRDKEIFNVKIQDIAKISFKQDNMRYDLELNKDNWVLLRPVSYSNLNQVDVKRVLGNILDISIKDFYDGDRKVNLADTSLLGPPRAIILVDNKNKVYSLNIGKEINKQNQYYARVMDKDLIFSIDKTIVDGLAKDLKKIEDKKAEDEKKLEEAKKEQEKKSEEARKEQEKKMKEQEKKDKANEKK